LAAADFFDRREAEAIAKKLDAEIRTGRKHDLVVIRWRGTIVCKYGMRRGSSSHPYIPNQIGLSLRQAIDLARCPLSRDEYFKLLRRKGWLPGPPSPLKEGP
jgi:hypothetical protein